MPSTIDNLGAISKIWGQNAPMPPLISRPVHHEVHEHELLHQHHHHCHELHTESSFKGTLLHWALAYVFDLGFLLDLCQIMFA